MNKRRRKQLQEIANELEGARARLELVMDEEQFAHDNMEEHFPDCDAVEQMQDAIDLMESAIGDIDSAVEDINEVLDY